MNFLLNHGCNSVCELYSMCRNQAPVMLAKMLPEQDIFYNSGSITWNNTFILIQSCFFSAL